MATHVMFDLETFGLGHNALFPTIGAVKFNGEKILDRWQTGVDVGSAEAMGLTMTASTVLYWLHPKMEAARAKLLALMPGVPLFNAMEGLGIWYEETPADERGSVWGKGSIFDIVKINSAYAALDLPVPWTYRQEECYRTMANRCPEIKYEQIGVAHDGLDDAESQAMHLIRICKDTGIKL